MTVAFPTAREGQLPATCDTGHVCAELISSGLYLLNGAYEFTAIQRPVCALGAGDKDQGERVLATRNPS